MTLDTGTRLGAFEITGLLGKGGMGEVYRARDTKLGREVAIKVLSTALTDDAEMLARFEREAVHLAALDHSNIGALHDFCHENGTHFLVMQLVEGETLADRIARGPIPAEEAVGLFSQVAEGLEAAHARGIIHRDLKPANIKVTPDDRVKILDFGIAKSIAGREGGNAATPTPSQRIDPAAPTRPMSPTPSTFQTGEGTFIGTPHYMSPEQARGKPVDRRADIWAFGVCLYQALSGVVPFDGETFSDVISAVLRTEPDWNTLPPATPPQLRRLLRDCLERDPRFRLRDIGEAWARMNRPRATDSPQHTPSTARQVTRFYAPFPPRHYLASTFSPFALAPDGGALVCALFSEGRINLHLRRMGALDFELLPGTENGRTPFFSPDGQWIGFSQSRVFKAIPLKGGAIRTIVECASTPIGAVWTPDNIIVWGELTTGLQKVNADGTNRAVLCTINPDLKERWQTPCCSLGNSGWMLANIVRQEAVLRTQLEFVSVRTGERRAVEVEAALGWYTDGGRLFVPDGNDIHAVPVDIRKPQTGMSPVRVLKNVAADDDNVVLADISSDGSLAYVPKDTVTQVGKLYWVDRRGGREQISVPSNYYVSPKISPDGNTIAVVAHDRAGIRQIHLLDWRRGVVEKITSERRAALTPIWHPDGSDLDYSSMEHGQQTIVRRISLDDSSVRNAGNSEFAAFAGDRSPDGRYLAVIRSAALTDFSIHIHDENGTEEPFVDTPGRHTCPRFHPSGGYITYISNESGRWEVYVKPFHRPGRRMQVSLEGGSDPVWARDGSELFYRNGDTLFSVRVEMDNGIRFGTPEALFNFEFGGKISPFIASYDVHPDGKRFVMSDVVAGDRGATGLVVVRNWTEELKNLLSEVPR